MTELCHLAQDLGFLSSCNLVEEADHLDSQVGGQLGDGAAASEHSHPSKLLTVLLPVVFQPQLDTLRDMVDIIVDVALDGVGSTVFL